MSRTVSKGDERKDTTRDTAETGDRKEALRRRKPDPERLAAGPAERQRNRRRGPKPRERRTTTAITHEIIDHTRRILKLREENPSAFQRAMAAAEMEEAEQTQAHTVDLESFFDSENHFFKVSLGINSSKSQVVFDEIDAFRYGLIRLL